MFFRKQFFASALLLTLTGAAQAGVIDTDFSEATIAATGMSLDQPNTANGEVSLDTVNDQLVLTSHFATNMYSARNDAPIAYVTKPTADTWYVETDIELVDPTDVFFLGGLTVYGDTDGALPNFTYHLNNWPNSGSRSVQLQGLGDNNPNVSASTTADNVILRIEFENDGGAGGLDQYTFLYDLLDGNGMQTLTTYDVDVANDRIGAFTKSRGDSPGAAVALNSFKVVAQVVPEPSSVMLILGGMLACGLCRRRAVRLALSRTCQRA